MALFIGEETKEEEGVVGVEVEEKGDEVVMVEVDEVVVMDV